MFPYLIAGAIGYAVAKIFESDEAPKYADGGSVLLAPNGKPSNLTPEQYKLVRTPEFKAWFGDWENSPKTASKVVDENGEPLVVYHGSNIDFNIFEKSKTNPYAEKQGYFFAFDKKYAESYNSKYVKPFFINIRIRGTFDDDDNLVPFNADGNIVEGLQVEVYDKKNIKLADGSNIKFDGNNPDIRYAGGGKVKKVKFDIEENEDEDRNEISIKGIGEVILTMTYPEYEFIDDIDEETLEELGVEEGDIIGKIEHLEINDKYKGQGYAKFLMNKAIEVAKEKGLMPLYLNASPMGSKGLDINDLTAFYESFGFEIFLEQGNNNLMILKDSNNTDISFKKGGEITTYTEFYDNLQIEDGSKYIGQKFGEVFPFISRTKTPNDYRIILKEYYGIIKRLEEDNYSKKAMKQRDLNKLKSYKVNIDKKKYLAGFYLSSNGIITKFVK